MAYSPCHKGLPPTLVNALTSASIASWFCFPRITTLFLPDGRAVVARKYSLYGFTRLLVLSPVVCGL